MFDSFRETHAAVTPDSCSDRPAEPSACSRHSLSPSPPSLPDTLLPPSLAAVAEVALSRGRRLHEGLGCGRKRYHPPPSERSRCVVDWWEAARLELLQAVSAVAAGADDLRGVEALLADVVERVVEETRQLAERLGLEVVLLVNLLALLDLVLESVQSGVDGILQIVQTLCRLLLDDVETRGEVGCAEGAESQQKQTGKDAGEEEGGIGLSVPGTGETPADTLSPLVEQFLCGILVVRLRRLDGRWVLVGDGLLCDGCAEEAQHNDGSTHGDDGVFADVPEG